MKILHYLKTCKKPNFDPVKKTADYSFEFMI